MVNFDPAAKRVQLASDAYDHIDIFNNEHQDLEVHLQPEFGNWMVEAVPSEPYGTLEDADQILSVGPKLYRR